MLCSVPKRIDVTWNLIEILKCKQLQICSKRHSSLLNDES